jgi:branched-chain amino acid transport system ATP-binding protein
MTVLLEVRGLSVAYGAILALDGADLTVGAGEAVALLGANGAGKSTLMQAVMGLLPGRAGTIRFGGVDLAGRPPEARATLGLGFVPEGRRVFPGMSVEDNLLVASRRGPADRARAVAEIYGLFPALGEKRRALGWQLSGGQQQMLAIGRALMTEPRLLLLDEPSLGLAPILVADVLAQVRRIADAGTAVLIAEQNVGKALAITDRAYVLQVGRMVDQGPSADLARSDSVRAAFLGA